MSDVDETPKCKNHGDDLLLVYRSSGRQVPDRMLQYYVDHPDIAKEKIVVMCVHCWSKNLDTLLERKKLQQDLR